MIIFNFSFLFSTAITAARHGASIANHVAVTDLVKDEEGKLIGAKMKDQISGEEWVTKAKSIINATGPFTDAIRKMDNQVCKLFQKYVF